MNDNKTINSIGVVADTVESHAGEVWKQVPGFSRYYASDRQRVKFLNSKGVVVLVQFREISTSVGTYWMCSATDDDGVVRFKSLHQLVCLAFHGPTPTSINGEKWVVNHKDSDKHNCVPNNLEWMTQSENCLHALKEGKRKDNLSMTVFDRQKNVTHTVHSISEAARLTNLQRYEVKNLLTVLRNKTKESRWVITLIGNPDKAVLRDSFRAIKVFDYVEDREMSFVTIEAAMYCTSVGTSTIRLRLDRKNISLLAGYVFKCYDDNLPWPVFSYEEATASRDSYFLKKETQTKNDIVQVKNYVDGTIHEFTKYKEVASYTGLSKRTVSRTICAGTKLIRGYGIRLKTKDPFPVFHPLQVEKSLHCRLHQIPPYEIIDLTSSTTKIFYTIFDFARSLNCDLGSYSHIVSWVNNHYPGRYKIKKLSYE